MMFRIFSTILVFTLLFSSNSYAFCGLYVARATSDIYNKHSKVVIARDDNKTVISLASDYQGEPKEFALLIPVPDVVERDQIHITENQLVDHLDAYTAPRLVEYYDQDPCNTIRFNRLSTVMQDRAPAAPSAATHTVKVEAEYAVGEYNIQIVSATKSKGLISWLKNHGYTVPEKANSVLDSYIKQGNYFFLAKVNLEKFNKSGRTYLRPIQVAFESPKFMLPIRLGMVNAEDSQEMLVFTLTRKGRVESANYRTVKIPTDKNLPLFVKDEFDRFYKDMFDRQIKNEKGAAVFLEYAWNMNWCDPCAADPLKASELRELGAFWVQDIPNTAFARQNDTYVTRMHLRYDTDNFPEDLFFHETKDKSNFQARYVLHHPWQGSIDCEAASEYKRTIDKRLEKSAQNLANLTGWDINEIRAKIKDSQDKPNLKWYQDIWK